MHRCPACAKPKSPFFLLPIAISTSCAFSACAPPPTPAIAPSANKVLPTAANFYLHVFFILVFNNFFIPAFAVSLVA